MTRGGVEIVEGATKYFGELNKGYTTFEGSQMGSKKCFGYSTSKMCVDIMT